MQSITSAALIKRQRLQQVRWPLVAQLVSAALTLLAITHADRALAHSPYFTQVEHVVLPDRQRGEMRLWHGDGILAPDPVRLIVLDAAGRLIGYSHESMPMTILCRTDRRCVGFDHGGDLVLEFDPSVPFAGPVVTNGVSAIAWRDSDDKDSKNIRVRAATVVEVWAANLALAQNNGALVTILVFIGAIAAFCGWFLYRLGLGKGWQLLGLLMIWMVVIGWVFVLLFVGMFLAWGSLSGAVWALSQAFGASLVLLLFTLRRRRFGTPSPAATANDAR